MNKKNLIITILFLCVSLFITTIPLYTYAADCNTSGKDSGTTLCNPLGSGKGETTDSLNELVGTIIKNVMGVVGSIALVIFIYGGLVLMTSAGNSQNVDKGKNIMIWAAVGLAIIFSSYILVKFVFTSLGVS